MLKFFTKKIIVLISILLPVVAFAVTGVIDPDSVGNKYAVFMIDDSQINFNCASCTVSITDDAITGDAWSENYGWINLSPSLGGVQNDGDGNLSGYAWGENAGWINFNPTLGGVSIVNGEFEGTAWSENIGWINFDCSDPNSCVETDWEPTAPVDDSIFPILGGGNGDNKCDDGLDNDGDGFTDYPNDLGCSSTGDDNESFVACADPLADNYQLQVNIHNQDSCMYSPIEGCMDVTALNFNVNASVSLDSCLYAGCTNPFAENYDENADFNDGSCLFAEIDDIDDGEVGGCLDPIATNYNASSDYENGSCIYSPIPLAGCTNHEASNYDPSAGVDNGSCDFSPVVVGGDDNANGGSFSKSNFVNYVKTRITKLSPWSSLLAILLYLLGRSNLLVALLVSPIRLFNLIPSLLGIRRKRRPWGVVFDSITKQPLDPAYVKLLLGKKEIATSITDLDGRYNFLVPAGVYNIFVNKTNYTFPSEKLKGKEKDVLYNNLYFGEKIETEKDDDLVIKNIPMDQISFNWNEFEKAKNKKLMRFYSKRDLFLAKIANTAFIVGISVSTLAAYFEPNILNIIILLFYLSIIILSFFGIKPTKPGFVIDSKTGYPLSYGILRVFSSSLNKEVLTTIIGKTGKYSALVKNGEYFLKIEQKIGEDEYKEIYKSPILKVKRGHISEIVKI